MQLSASGIMSRKVFVIAAAIMLIAALLAAYVFFAPLVNEDLIIYLTPSGTSFHANYGNITNVEFTAKTNYRAFCTASCNYSFTDQSSGTYIDNGSLELKMGSQIKKIYALKTERRGTGQSIYTFRISCRNNQATLCLTNGEEHTASSLATINYDYTDAELLLKNSMRTELSEYFNELNRLYATVQTLEIQIIELKEKTQLSDIEPLRAEMNSLIQQQAVYAEMLRTLWIQQEYALLKERFEKREELPVQKAELLNKTLQEYVIKHNEIVYGFQAISSKWNDLGAIESIANETGDSLLHKRIITAADNFSYTANRFSEIRYSNYEEIMSALEKINNSLETAGKKAAEDTEKIEFEANQLIENEKLKMCTAKGYCNLSDKNAMRGEGWRAGMCRNLNGLDSEFDNSQNYYAEVQLKAINVSLKGADAYTYLFRLWNISGLISQNSFNRTIAEMQTNLSAGKLLANNATLRFALKLSQGNETREFFRLHCTNYPKITLTLSNITLLRISIPEIKTGKLLEIEGSLTEPFPKCCVFGECFECCTIKSCRNDTYSYPIVFVHGISFNKNNAPEFTADAFSTMQRELESEGYINAGILYQNSSETDTIQGEWGLSGRPVMVSVAYYYDMLKDQSGNYILIPRKNHEIQIYAIRLRDLIEDVKYRTGRDKVIIVAHSMGGLVSRSYIQLFGSDSVHKLIMIGTPNNGVDKNAANLCSVLGAETECSDITEGSFFMRKLNDPENEKVIIPVHNIIGTGCETNGQDGDGIVANKSAYLENAKNHYIKGNCTSSVPPRLLHGDMLLPERTPEAFELIKGILKEK